MINRGKCYISRRFMSSWERKRVKVFIQEDGSSAPPSLLNGCGVNYMR